MTEQQLRRRRKIRKARQRHRQWYWREHDKDTHQCPACGAGTESVRRFEVHHRDGNPLNGNPENLVALCWECHLKQHGAEPTLSSLDVDEWKQEFAALGGEAP